jgi:hypothetical protein
MSLDPDSEIVQQRLALIGYSSEPIDRPGPNGKSADLWGHKETDCLVIEVKSRTDDAEIEHRLQQAPEGEMLQWEGDLGRKNRLSAVVEQASRQISDSQVHYAGIGVLWFRATPEIGFDDSEHQMQATLLGIRDICWIRGEEWRGSIAFFATYSDFFRFPNIDCAVLEIKDKGRLLLNPFSPRKEEMKRSRLYGFFAGNGSVLDVDALVPPKGFIVRGDVDRGDENAVRSALCDQYPGYKFVLFDMKSWGFVTKVSLPRYERV